MVAATKKVPKIVWILAILVSGILANLYVFVTTSRTSIQSVYGLFSASVASVSTTALVAFVIILALFYLLFVVIAAKIIFAIAIRICFGLSFKVTKTQFAFPVLKPDFERYFYIYVIIANCICSLLNIGYFLAPYTYVIMEVLALVIRFAVMTLGFFDMKKGYIPEGMVSTSYISIFIIYAPLMILGVL